MGTDYALHLLIAVEAAQQLAAEWVKAAQHWSPPISIDLSLCSIDCGEEYRRLRFRRVCLPERACSGRSWLRECEAIWRQLERATGSVSGESGRDRERVTGKNPRGALVLFPSEFKFVKKGDTNRRLLLNLFIIRDC